MQSLRPPFTAEAIAVKVATVAATAATTKMARLALIAIAYPLAAQYSGFRNDQF